MPLCNQCQGRPTRSSEATIWYPTRSILPGVVAPSRPASGRKAPASTAVTAAKSRRPACSTCAVMAGASRPWRSCRAGMAQRRPAPRPAGGRFPCRFRAGAGRCRSSAWTPPGCVGNGSAGRRAAITSGCPVLGHCRRRAGTGVDPARPGDGEARVSRRRGRGPWRRHHEKTPVMWITEAGGLVRVLLVPVSRVLVPVPGVLVPRGRLELPRGYPHYDLNVARLPIPPPGHHRERCRHAGGQRAHKSSPGPDCGVNPAPA